VARDPSFFDAYCALAVHHDQLYFFGFDHTPARLASAEAAIQEAFRIRPNAGEAHLRRAYHLYNGYLDYEGALAELEVARQTLPNHPRIFSITGFIQRRQGAGKSPLEISSGHLSSTRAASTRSTTSQIVTAYLRRYAEQKSKLDRILAIEPNDVPAKAERACVELNWKADTRPLHQLIDEIRATNPAAMPQIALRG
jgi:tetratricopeptide (TPR) repeat protein